LYLTAAGLGTIGVVDSDTVELSNLQRQVIHFNKDLNVPKVTSAAEKMQAKHVRNSIILFENNCRI
jgi:molybdopterin/thiamine biosynthesis adenylyltransferase